MQARIHVRQALDVITSYASGVRVCRACGEIACGEQRSCYDEILRCGYLQVCLAAVYHLDRESGMLGDRAIVRCLKAVALGGVGRGEI